MWLFFYITFSPFPVTFSLFYSVLFCLSFFCVWLIYLIFIFTCDICYTFLVFWFVHGHLPHGVTFTWVHVVHFWARLNSLLHIASTCNHRLLTCSEWNVMTCETCNENTGLLNSICALFHKKNQGKKKKKPLAGDSALTVPTCRVSRDKALARSSALQCQCWMMNQVHKWSSSGGSSTWSKSHDSCTT